MRAIDFFDNGHDMNPQAVCMVDDESGREYTFAEVRHLTLKTGNALLSMGFGRGARGAVLSINHAIGFSCALSLLRAGMAWVPINAGNAVQENIHALADFGCVVLFYHSQFEPVLEQIREHVPAIQLYVCLDKRGAASPWFDEWVGTFSDDEIDIETNAEDLATIQPTGGTTGRSKGARLTNRAIQAFVMTNLAITSYDDLPPVYLSAAPMTHAGGYVCFSILARGGKLIIQSKIEPARFLAAIAKYGVCATFLPPTVIYMLLNEPGIRSMDFSSLRHLMYGAAPMSPDKLTEAMEVFGPVMTQLFGQSECLFPITYLSPADHAKAIRSNDRQVLASCGKPAPFSRLAIMSVDGLLLGPGEVGEIVVRTPMLMQGYHDAPALTSQVSAYGWHHTGDVGYRDADNFYYIVDRKNDMIISGGFNVYSAEVEKAVMAHPAVQECVVIGVPHEKWGEEVKAIVELREGSGPQDTEIIAKCKALVGSVKAPKSVEFVASLPRNANGKVMKRLVRDRYWGNTARQVN